MQTGGRVNNRIACIQFHPLLAISVADDQLTALISIGIGEKHSGRHIAAHFFACVRHGEHGIVDVVAISGAALIAVKQRWQHFQRQSHRHEQWAFGQLFQDQLPHLLGSDVVARQLLVGFHMLGDVACGQATVLPILLVQQFATTLRFSDTEQLGNAYQHFHSFIETTPSS